MVVMPSGLFRTARGDTYVVHYSSPAFHRNTLEDGEHGEYDAVEADDSVLGTFPASRADGLVDGTDETAAAETAAAAVAARR